MESIVKSMSDVFLVSNSLEEYVVSVFRAKTSHVAKYMFQDPMSHRIIEKRRRDRMNNCLADLSRLIPADYLKKGRGRIEKTEIIEMAIKHMKHLQGHACRQLDSCELAQQQSQEEGVEPHPTGGPIITEHYRLGYQECLSEAMHFLVEVEGFFAGDTLCVQLINHLQKHCDKILKGDRLNFPRMHHGETTSTSSNSSGSGGYGNHHGSSVPSGSSGLSSSSPNSGSCSDSGRMDNRDSGIASGIPSSPPQPVTTILSTDVGDNSCCEDSIVNLHGSSQLREMLTSSNLTSLHGSQTTAVSAGMPQTTSVTGSRQLIQSPPSSVQTASSLQYPSASTDQSSLNGGRSVAALYKFKNNIKQRFTAEHHVDGDEAVAPSSDCSGVKRKRCLFEPTREHVPGNSSANPKRRDSDTCSVPSSPPSPPTPKYSPCTPSPPPHSSLINPSYGVPIFALHSKGSFYVPLTLDAEILAPYLAAVGFGPDGNGIQNGNTSSVSDSVVLHPVTISVNFQQTNHHRTHHQHHSRQHNNFYSSVTSWKRELNDFLPMPKWSIYSPDRN
ncbi:Hairy/enhancer-of-split related with YRPW motif protein 2 [Zootermopsis nevadensis]|uniref:Hairy/enhancer-of-split related with YRPW motif protein 2 n=1 Tax=Zootermopsis nevadensis TaxID=136037 RepID=A0A067R2R8_ZOONE|nr:Hairy/enhancer-of-split related with YRPW motif protein 2 [Zootermopsis nevadensis]